MPSSAVAADAASDNQVEELIVTAQKRDQSLQDVPIPITAISGAEIKKAALPTFMDLQQYAPGLVSTNHGRSEERRVGTGLVSTLRYRWSKYPNKNNR